MPPCFPFNLFPKRQLNIYLLFLKVGPNRSSFKSTKYFSPLCEDGRLALIFNKRLNAPTHVITFFWHCQYFLMFSKFFVLKLNGLPQGPNLEDVHIVWEHIEKNANQYLSVFFCTQVCLYVCLSVCLSLSVCLFFACSYWATIKWVISQLTLIVLNLQSRNLGCSGGFARY